MRDSLELLQKSLEDYAGNKNLQNHMLGLLECLYKDLESERSTNTNLQQQIVNLTKQENFGITSKFAALKADFAALKLKLSLLKNENDDLNIQLIAKGEETKRLLAEKEEEMKSYYLNQVKQKDEAINQKDQEVEACKQTFKLKEQRFYEEIQAAEAAAALEKDELETDFRRLINESNKKLKDSMDTCNILRVELMSVKEQFVEYKNTSREKLAQLQRRLTDCQNSESVSSSKSTESVSVSSVPVNLQETSRYQPLDISCKNFSPSGDAPINLKKVRLYRSSVKIVDESRKYMLPPLLEMKNANLGVQPVKKRRKLYNPDDYSYLNPNNPNKEK